MPAAEGELQRVRSLGELGINAAREGFAGVDFIERVRVSRAPPPKCGALQRYSRFVLREANLFRAVWQLLIGLLLLYTGTIFCYHLAFVENRFDLHGDGRLSRRSPWSDFDDVVYGIFVVDLFISFFLSYRDDDNVEVVDLPSCVIRYLKTTLIVNLIACFPYQVLTVPMGSQWNATFRVLRLQRITRMVRLVRTRRLFDDIFVFDWVAWVEQFKLVRVANKCLALIWIVHMLACGWYLCAALHRDKSTTWVARREVPADEARQALGDSVMPLGERPPFDIWMNSMYFVVTVFTTVGFGDMSASTAGEIVYVVFLMVVGVVVHSIIIGEVVELCTSNDRMNDFVSSRKDLVDAFAQHTELDEEPAGMLSAWIFRSARYWMKYQYAHQDMRELIVGRSMPRDLMRLVSDNLFGGALIKNELLRCPFGAHLTLPPRLPMLVALSLSRAEFARGDIIYDKGDYPFNIFLVVKGNFGYTATSRADAEDDLVSLFPCGSYFGDYEVFAGGSRKYTSKCICEAGSCVLLSRSDLVSLAEEFPEWGLAWRRRANYRHHRITKGRAAKTAEIFAASLLQRMIRRRRRRGNFRVTEKGPAEPDEGQVLAPPLREAAEEQLGARVSRMEATLDRLLETLRARTHKL